MRLVLTGGSGFIGRACHRLAGHAGHDVLVISRRQRTAASDPGGRWLVADLNDAESYESMLADFRPEAVVHLAWEGIPDYSLENSLRNVAAGGMFGRRVFDAGCTRLVVGGSCWEYGVLTGHVSENDEPCNVGVFGACKTAQRNVLSALAGAAHGSLAWGRIFYAYGPGQKTTSLAPTLCADLLAGHEPRPRNPQAVNDFIYVDDVAVALLMLATTSESGIFNIGSGVGVSVGTFADELARAAGVSMKRLASAQSAAIPGLIADVSRLHAIGWRPRTSLEAGLCATWSAFREDNKSRC